MALFAALVVASFLVLVPASAAGLPGDFEQEVESILDDHDAPGASVVLVRGGEVIFEGGFGYADLENDRRVDGDTRFRIGSSAKMITALTLLTLVEEEEVSLDDRVTRLVRDAPLENRWSSDSPVQVAHLLEHTAGFDDMRFRNWVGGETLPERLDEVVQRLDDELRVRWEPGVRPTYNNPGYLLAGAVVESVTDQPFWEYSREAVLDPLEIEGDWGVPEDEPPYARGYTGGEVEPHRPLLLYPAGDFNASARDVSRLLEFLIDGGSDIVSDELLERMRRSETTAGARAGMHLSFGLGNAPQIHDGYLIHGHGGMWAGFNASIGYSPDHEFGYAVLLNTAGPALSELVDYLVPIAAEGTEPPQPGADDPAEVDPPEEMTGWYRAAAPRNEVLRMVDFLIGIGRLDIDGAEGRFVNPFGESHDIAMTGDDRFRHDDEAHTVGVFLPDHDPEALQYGGWFERTSAFSALAPLVAVGVVLALMLSSLLFFPVWAFRKLRGKLKRVRRLSPRVFPLLAVVAFAAVVFTAAQLDLATLGERTPATVAFFVSGAIFALMATLSPIVVFRYWSEAGHPAARWHSAAVSMAVFCFALFLMYFDLVPLQTWTW